MEKNMQGAKKKKYELTDAQIRRLDRLCFNEVGGLSAESLLTWMEIRGWQFELTIENEGICAVITRKSDGLGLCDWYMETHYVWGAIAHAILEAHRVDKKYRVGGPYG